MAKKTSIDEWKEQYLKTLNARSWLEMHYYISKDPSQPSIRERLLSLLHKVIEKAQPKGRVLDLGSGGSLLSILAISKFADEIVMTGFLENERVELNKWLTKDIDAWDWTIWFDLQAKHEPHGTSAAAVEERIRRKVTGILPCDVNLSNPLEPYQTEQFDAITMVAVMEPACPTEEAYMEAAKNVASLLKPNGQLLVVSLLGGKYYFVGENKYNCLPTNILFLQSAYEKAGFKDVEFELLDMTYNNQFACVTGGAYGMRATKI